MRWCLGLPTRWVAMLFLVATLPLFLFPVQSVRAADAPSITAEYAVVVSLETGEVLFEQSMDEPVAPASLTKIFTAAVALDLAPLDRTMTVASEDLVGESSMGISPGEELTMETLLYGLMLSSGNDAAATIARNLGAKPGDSAEQAVERFMNIVNDTAARLGLRNTHLVNPHGLDEPDHQSSARDIAAMTMYALENPTFRTLINTPFYWGEGYEIYQGNALLGQYEGLIGGKTGITEAAGYSLVEVAERDGQTVIAVLLGSTRADWYADATALLDYGFESLAAQPTDAARPRITLAPQAPETVVPTVGTTETVGTLQVDRVAETTAVVQSAGGMLGPAASSWRWPLASLITMGLAFALIVNYPVLLGLGGLALQSRGLPRVLMGGSATLGSWLFRPRRRRVARYRRRAHPRARTRTTARGERGFVNASIYPTAPAASRPVIAPAPVAPSPARWRPTPNLHTGEEAGRVVPLNSAEAIATRAIRLAQRSDYQAATDEFVRALRLDPHYDLSRCAGFWSMQPAGYVAAARAYLLLNRPADARTLATVVQLSYGTNRELERLLASTGSPVYS